MQIVNLEDVEELGVWAVTVISGYPLWLAEGVPWKVCVLSSNESQSGRDDVEYVR